MIVERVRGLSFDVQALREYLEETVLPLEPTMQGPGFGGWSVLSSNGDYRDGWQMGHLAHVGSGLDREVKKQRKLKPDMFFYRPTEIYRGYIREVLETLERYHLNPKRARITMVPPGHDTSWHRDAPEGTYCARLHVPIVTNPGCYFSYSGQEPYHMAADGSCYVVDPSFLHRAGNTGHEPRYHLLVNIWDSQGVTENFPYRRSAKRNYHL